MSDVKKKSIIRPLPKVLRPLPKFIEVLKDHTIVGKASSSKAPDTRSSSTRSSSARSSSSKIPIPKASSPKASSPKTPSSKAPSSKEPSQKTPSSKEPTAISSTSKIPIPEKVQKTNFISERYRIFMENRKKKQQIKIIVNERKRAIHDALIASSNSSPTQELMELAEYRKDLKAAREQILGNKKNQQEKYDPHGFRETY